MSHGCWQPAASLPVLRERSRVLGAMRDFFRRAGVMEVETPICSAHAATDPALQSFVTGYTGPGAATSPLPLYLHTSPEFAMKRLLAAGTGPIYQICKVFRDGECGARHNPEFSLLEWYLPGFDHLQLMDEVAALVTELVGVSCPVERYTYSELCARYLGLDPHAAAVDELCQVARSRGIEGPSLTELDRSGWLDLLWSHCVEAELGREGMTFVYDYPAAQASLARIRSGPPAVAERFELYVGGMELANGFHELADADEQARRFEAELSERHHQGRPEVPMDRNLLDALAAGLPDCAGVALGIDRLLMWLLGEERIDRVLAFPLDRA